MKRDWESVFTKWSTGPSKTEREKAANAESQVKEAISASERLRTRNIRVFTQGSYRNRVNVRRDSDVDVAVLCYDVFFPDYQDDNVKARVAPSLEDATYTYSVFKNEVEAALVARFGRDAVVRGPKAFDIKSNSYRIEADVAPFFEHRRYTTPTAYHSGVEMIPDDLNPPLIRNWPDQHYENGVAKNQAAQRRFKRVVRVIKSLSNEMSSKSVASATATPSFLIECLVWNTPDKLLIYDTYVDTIRATLAHLYSSTETPEPCNEWGEVSELKYLFRPSQPWTRETANRFVLDAWRYIGY